MTGGGTGIGEAVAHRLAAEGCAIAVLGRRVEPIERVAAAVEAAGGAALAVSADVADETAVQAPWPRRSPGSAGSTSSSTTRASATAHRCSRRRPRAGTRRSRANLTGAFLVCRGGAPAPDRASRVRSSTSPRERLVVGPDWASYCVSKAGLTMLTRSLAVDYGPRGVRANAVCPGWVRTPDGR